jgi:hypothetical protein
MEGLTQGQIRHLIRQEYESEIVKLKTRILDLEENLASQVGAVDVVSALLSEIGFESIAAFLSYCEGHSDTPRALFNSRQIGLAQILGGEVMLGASNFLADPISWVSADLRSLCQDARKRIRTGR